VIGERVETVRSDDTAADTVENTRRFNAVFADIVRRHPDQWIWMQQALADAPARRAGDLLIPRACPRPVLICGLRGVALPHKNPRADARQGREEESRPEAEARRQEAAHGEEESAPLRARSRSTARHSPPPRPKCGASAATRRRLEQRLGGRGSRDRPRSARSSSARRCSRTSSPSGRESSLACEPRCRIDSAGRRSSSAPA